jgi:DNA-binding winged helix-turn-helix (wHTH) protein
MLQREPAGRFVRFGSFEADLQEGKLTKAGGRVRLQEQPFRLLALLLERPGQLVTREEIQQKLWSHDTFVEFDAALNTAVRKLRAALNDSADSPRFLETVPRRGYRFVAPMAWPPAAQTVAPIKPRVRRRPYLGLAAAVLVAGVAVAGFWHLRHHFQRHHRARRFCQPHGQPDLRRHPEDGA